MTDASPSEVLPGGLPGVSPAETLFSAELIPYRSLGRTGFTAVMVLLGGISFVAGVSFMLMGAWPIFGFFGLDVLLVWWAFRANYRAAAAREYVTVTPHEVIVRHVSARGDTAISTFNPRWVRIATEEIEGYGVDRLYLVSHGRRHRLTGFIGPQEKTALAEALRAAIAAARR